MKQIRKRLTYANVMSSIAVFLVLGGATALAANQLGKNTVGAKQLKKDAVTTAKIKNGAVTGAKVNLSSLGTVPSASNANHAAEADKATTAEKATTATTAEKANTATTAATASNSNLLGGEPPSSYAKTTLEPLHFVGTAGNPGFQNGCGNFTPSGEFVKASFYKDSFGIVHLNGFLSGCTSGLSAFTLPPGFRPEGNELYVTRGGGDTSTGTLRIAPNGGVEPFSTTNPTLSGITFRAAG